LKAWVITSSDICLFFGGYSGGACFEVRWSGKSQVLYHFVNSFMFSKFNEFLSRNCIDQGHWYLDEGYLTRALFSVTACFTVYWLGKLVLQVVSNTTISRPDSILGLVHAEESGGLSGKPLYHMATEALHDMYVLTKVIFLICFASPSIIGVFGTKLWHLIFEVPLFLPFCHPHVTLPIFFFHGQIYFIHHTIWCLHSTAINMLNVCNFTFCHLGYVSTSLHSETSSW